MEKSWIIKETDNAEISRNGLNSSIFFMFLLIFILLTFFNNGFFNNGLPSAKSFAISSKKAATVKTTKNEILILPKPENTTNPKTDNNPITCALVSIFFANINANIEPIHKGATIL